MVGNDEIEGGQIARQSFQGGGAIGSGFDLVSFLAQHDGHELPQLEEIFGDSDVYTANPPADAQILVRGQVLKGMKPTDEPVEGKKNEPMQPVVWVREWKGEGDKACKIITTTMGAATDLQDEGLRRLMVNAVFWATGREVPPKADVSYVGEYKPTFYGFNAGKKGLKPQDYELKAEK